MPLWQGQLLAAGRHLESRQQLRQHWKVAASLLPAALRRPTCLSWLPAPPGCSRVLGFTRRLGRWRWEETRSGSPSLGPVFLCLSLYVSLCFSLQAKVFSPKIPAGESQWDQPINHPTNQCPFSVLGHHRPAAGLSPSAYLRLCLSQTSSGVNTRPVFKSWPYCVTLARNLTARCLSFFICKRDITGHPS